MYTHLAVRWPAACQSAGSEAQAQQPHATHTLLHPLCCAGPEANWQVLSREDDEAKYAVSSGKAKGKLKKASDTSPRVEFGDEAGALARCCLLPLRGWPACMP
jgi:hypothetical protein